MKRHHLCTLLILLLPTAATLAQHANRLDACQNIIDSIRTNDVPDQRTAVYDITAHQNGNTLVLRGNISDNRIHAHLIQALQKHNITPIDSIRLLPEHTMGNAHWGIVSLSAIYIRKEPSFRAEIVTQALLGTPVKILDKKNSWMMIQTPDQYIGWTVAPIQPITENQLNEANNTPKTIVTRRQTLLYTHPSDKAEPIMELLMGNILTLEKPVTNKRFTPVALPDGTKGYIHTKAISPLPQWWQSAKPTGESIINLSRQFIGLPYLWGGASTRGMDCSGFTKTIFFMHGIILPRDASQQFHCGTPIPIARHKNNLQQGDLLFFGNQSKTHPHNTRITHVAISMGGNLYIHASGTGKIKINSLNPADPNYDTYNAPRLCGARRIIGQPQIHLWNITEHTWYHGQHNKH